MQPVSVVRRPLFGRASKSDIAGEEEAVAAGLQRQSRLLSPLRALVLQRSASGNTLLASSPPPASASKEAEQQQTRPSSLSSSAEAAGAVGDPHPLPGMPLKLGFQQRWVERGYLFSYVLDFIVGPVYDRVLLPRSGALRFV